MRHQVHLRFASLLAIGLLAVVAACTTPERLAPGPVAASSLARYPIRSSGDIVQDKTFYLLTLLQSDAKARAAVAADPGLSVLALRLSGSIQSAYSNCAGSTHCMVEGMIMSDADIEIAGERLAALAAPGGSLNAVVRDEMRTSLRFQRHAELDDAAMMRAAWLETAAGVNRLYRIYGLGDAPRYPAIDSVSYGIETPQYASLVRAVLETQIDGARSSDAFFASWLRVGLDLLVINQRDEAARYEPMERGINAAAFAKSRITDWSRTPHVAILIPGAGTLPGETGLSAAGALRIRLAARRYAEGLAPFIIVSGGHVHPNKTPYAEAIEMKRELERRYGVPGEAILVDPHARHTTTNLRNAVRLIHALGAPLSGTVLVTTSRDQSQYIESQVFVRRNSDELGYQPLTLLGRRSLHDLVMAQNLMSLHADPRDPLDP